jgi:hypothetical protein
MDDRARARAAVLIDHDGEPALVTGAGCRENPDDATLPLRWICERLRRCAAERVAVVLSAAAPGDRGPARAANRAGWTRSAPRAPASSSRSIRRGRAPRRPPRSCTASAGRRSIARPAR